MYKKVLTFILLLFVLVSCKKLMEYNSIDDSKTIRFSEGLIGYEANYNEAGGILQFITINEVSEPYKAVVRFEYDSDGNIIVLAKTTFDFAGNELSKDTTMDKDVINNTKDTILDFIAKHTN